jgi:hypothetical protein
VNRIHSRFIEIGPEHRQMNRFDAQRENTNLGADHGCTGHAYVWGPHVTSGLYGAPLDYREASSIYFDPGSWQSRYNNRQLNFTLEYRDFQLMQIEWLAGRALTPAEIASIWGPISHRREEMIG